MSGVKVKVFRTNDKNTINQCKVSGVSTELKDKISFEDYCEGDKCVDVYMIEDQTNEDTIFCFSRHELHYTLAKNNGKLMSGASNIGRGGRIFNIAEIEYIRKQILEKYNDDIMNDTFEHSVPKDYCKYFEDNDYEHIRTKTYDELREMDRDIEKATRDLEIYIEKASRDLDRDKKFIELTKKKEMFINKKIQKYIDAQECFLKLHDLAERISIWVNNDATLYANIETVMEKISTYIKKHENMYNLDFEYQKIPASDTNKKIYFYSLITSYIKTILLHKPDTPVWFIFNELYGIINPDGHQDIHEIDEECERILMPSLELLPPDEQLRHETSSSNIERNHSIYFDRLECMLKKYTNGDDTEFLLSIFDGRSPRELGEFIQLSGDMFDFGNIEDYTNTKNLTTYILYTILITLNDSYDSDKSEILNDITKIAFYIFQDEYEDEYEDEYDMSIDDMSIDDIPIQRSYR